MQDYCEDRRDCRRKFFSLKFGETLCTGSTGSTLKAFKGCGSMCDNCLANKGATTRQTSPISKRGAADAVEVRMGDGIRKRKGRGGGGFRSAKSLILEVKENEANAAGRDVADPEVICLDQQVLTPWISIARQRHRQ